MWRRTTTAWRQRDRWTHDAAPRLCHQSKKEEANRRVLRLAEDDCADEKAAAPWRLQGGLDLHFRLRGLQSGAHAKPRGRSSCGVSRGRSVSRSARKIALGARKALRINLSDIDNDENNERRKRKLCPALVFQQPARAEIRRRCERD